MATGGQLGGGSCRVSIIRAQGSPAGIHAWQVKQLGCVEVVQVRAADAM